MSRVIFGSLFSLILAAALAFPQSEPVQAQASPAQAQAAQPEAKQQTPRQALIEIVNAKDAPTLLKHLPQATKEMLRKSGGPDYLPAGSDDGQHPPSPDPDGLAEHRASRDGIPSQARHL